MATSGQQATQELRLQVGDIVVHAGFGPGKVTNLVPDRPNTAWIVFQRVGLKLMSFAAPHDRFFREVNGIAYAPTTAPPARSPSPPAASVPPVARDPARSDTAKKQPNQSAVAVPEIPVATTIVSLAHAASQFAPSITPCSSGLPAPAASSAPAPRPFLQVGPLYYMAPLENLHSILHLGLLSLNQLRRAGETPRSIADPGIQDLRDRIYVVNGGQTRGLHDYVPLYFVTRTAMIFRRYEVQDQIAYLEIDPTVLELPGVVVSDGNASAQGLRKSGTGTVHVFVACAASDACVRDYRPRWSGPTGNSRSELYSGPHAIGRLPWPAILAPSWAGDEETKRQKQAEAMVPNEIAPRYFRAVHVRVRSALEQAREAAAGVGVSVSVRMSPHFYAARVGPWRDIQTTAEMPLEPAADEEAAWAAAIARAEGFEEDEPDYPF